MRLLVFVVAFLVSMQAQSANLPWFAITPAQAAPALVFNVTDPPYNAKCDGLANDDAAINAALTAAFNSSAYQNNNAVAITGPQGLGNAGCIINSLDFTKFSKGNAGNVRPRVEFYGITLLCTGARTICLDGLNANVLHLHDISLRGDTPPNSPEIGIQIGVALTNTSSAFHVFERVNVNGDFALAAFYNFGSETFNCITCYFTNAHTTSGPVGVLGSITGGSGYVNATYTNVPLTGGTGSGALATVVVAAGSISSVTLTYEGRDYAPADVLSAAAASLGGSGSGFSVPVSTVTPYTVIQDGQNHWRAASAFITEVLPVDTWSSFTGNKFFGGSIRQNGAGKAAVWAARTEGLHFYQTYLYAGAATPSFCIALYDNGITKASIPPGNSSLSLDIANCEGGVTGSILLTGGNATPTLLGFNLYAAIESASAIRPTFVEDTGITSVTMSNATLRVDWYTVTASQMFKTPSLYTITGNAFVPATSNWGSPVSFTGQLCTPASCVTH